MPLSRASLSLDLGGHHAVPGQNAKKWSEQGLQKAMSLAAADIYEYGNLVIVVGSKWSIINVTF